MRAKASARKVHTCHICQKAFGSELSLLRHSETHQGNENTADKEQEVKPENFICNICTSVCSSSSDLTRHQLEQKHFECDHCGEVFRQESSMRRHYKHSHPSEASPSKKWQNILAGNKQPVVLLGDRVDSFQTDKMLSEDSENMHYDISDSEFHCRGCDAKFGATADMLEHIRTHSAAAETSKSSSSQKIDTDLQEVRAESEFQCEECEESFIDQTDFDSHVCAQQETDLVCDVCDKTFENKFSLKKHETQHYDTGEILTVTKKHVTARKSMVKLYSDRKIGELTKIFTCQECFKEFASKSDLDIHMAAAHKGSVVSKLMDKELEKEVGGEVESEPIYADEENADVGEQSAVASDAEMEVVPGDLEPGFPGMGLESNMSDHEEETAETVDKEPEEGSFAEIVNECINKVISKVVVKEENEPTEDDTENIPVVNENSTPVTEPKPRKRLKNVIRQPMFECAQCDQVFKRKSALQRHAKYNHLVKSHDCVECGETFGRRNNLVRHIHRVHHEPSFECLECNKTFSVKYDLTRHMKCHQPKNMVQCAQCDESFLYKKDMKIHRRLVHKFAPQITDEEPVVIPDFVIKETGQPATVFRCSLCPRMFALKTDLLRHFLVHSGERPFDCGICDASFNRKSNLVRHKKLMHKITTDMTKNKKRSDILEWNEKVEGEDAEEQQDNQQGLELSLLKPDEKITVRILTF